MGLSTANGFEQNKVSDGKLLVHEPCRGISALYCVMKWYAKMNRKLCWKTFSYYILNLFYSFSIPWEGLRNTTINWGSPVVIYDRITSSKKWAKFIAFIKVYTVKCIYVEAYAFVYINILSPYAYMAYIPFHFYLTSNCPPEVRLNSCYDIRDMQQPVWSTAFTFIQLHLFYSPFMTKMYSHLAAFISAADMSGVLSPASVTLITKKPQQRCIEPSPVCLQYLWHVSACARPSSGKYGDNCCTYLFSLRALTLWCSENP